MNTYTVNITRIEEIAVLRRFLAIESECPKEALALCLNDESPTVSETMKTILVNNIKGEVCDFNGKTVLVEKFEQPLIGRGPLEMTDEPKTH